MSRGGPPHFQSFYGVCLFPRDSRLGIAGRLSYARQHTPNSLDEAVTRCLEDGEFDAISGMLSMAPPALEPQPVIGSCRRPDVVVRPYNSEVIASVEEYKNGSTSADDT